MTDFNWRDHLQETACHLLLMARVPGWQEHARMRRDEILADPLYGAALREEIKRQMREAKETKA